VQELNLEPGSSIFSPLGNSLRYEISLSLRGRLIIRETARRSSDRRGVLPVQPIHLWDAQQDLDNINGEENSGKETNALFLIQN
jgi:hypothetical protein